MPSSQHSYELELCTLDRFVALRDSLAELLQACVEGGASINFVPPFSVEQARQWWDTQCDSLKQGRALLFVAVQKRPNNFNSDRAASCVILEPAMQVNQPHRAEVRKMLVHPECRRSGLGGRLLRLLEEEALMRGRWLLTLDTEKDSPGEKLYIAQGYIPIGSIPKYALSGDGQTHVAATFFYKDLGEVNVKLEN